MTGPNCPACGSNNWAFDAKSGGIRCQLCNYHITRTAFTTLPVGTLTPSSCDNCRPPVTTLDKITENVTLKVTVQPNPVDNTLVFVCADCGGQLYIRKPKLVRPMLTNYLVGWRRWRRHGGKGILLSPWDDAPWLPKQAFEAVCNPKSSRHSYQHSVPSPGPQHECPHKDCSCGVYAFREPQEEWLNHALREQQPYGLVALWGIVIQHTLGWRAQYAYPLKIYALSKHHLPTFELYEAEVELVSDERAYQHFAEKLKPSQRLEIMKKIVEQRGATAGQRYKWTIKP